MTDIISRKDALALAYRRFYTGRPCKYGHDCERYTTSGACVVCTNPKIPEAEKGPPIESFKLPNGRIVTLLSQDEAHAKGAPNFFTGQPCDEGHLVERNTKNGRCLQCMHPAKTPRDGMTGAWAFAPKPPLFVPAHTPKTVWHKLREKLQAEIPRLLQEIESEGGAPVAREPEALHILGIFHRHHYQMWEGCKVWWPFPPGAREKLAFTIPSVGDFNTPWFERDGQWFAVLPDSGKIVPVELVQERYDSDKGQRVSQQAVANALVEVSDEERARVRAEQKRIMEL